MTKNFMDNGLTMHSRGQRCHGFVHFATAASATGLEIPVGVSELLLGLRLLLSLFLNVRRIVAWVVIVNDDLRRF